MSYQEEYQKKLTTAEEAVKVVKSGDWVDYTWCGCHPIALDKALAARKDELVDVKVRGGVTMWMPEICKAEDAGDHFTWHSWHCSGIDRKIIAKGMGFFSPMRYSELPRFYRENINVDVAMIQADHTHGRIRQLQLRPELLSSGGHDRPCQVRDRGGQPEHALGQRTHRHGSQHQGR